MKMLVSLCLGLGFALQALGAAAAADPLHDAPPVGYYAFQKVVYQNDSGWPDDRGYFERLLRNLAAHIADRWESGDSRRELFGRRETLPICQDRRGSGRQPR